MYIVCPPAITDFALAVALFYQFKFFKQRMFRVHYSIYIFRKFESVSIHEAEANILHAETS